MKLLTRPETSTGDFTVTIVCNDNCMCENKFAFNICIRCLTSRPTLIFRFN